MTESRWLEFVLIPNPGTRRTDAWAVLSKMHSVEGSGGISRLKLGEVKWFPRWRQYGFFPAPETIFNPECLGDLLVFITEQTKRRRKNHAHV